jgi:DNA-binding MarR family transcriptional regulator
MSLAAVSKHIQVLERAGLARRTVDGRVHHLALRPDGLRTAAEWVAYYQHFWDESLARLNDVLSEGNGQ